MSTICDGCGNTSTACRPDCPRRKKRPAEQVRRPWRPALRDLLARLVDAVTCLPYAPGEVDPRPVLGGGPRPTPPSAAEPAPPVKRAHAAGTRPNLRPVGELLAAAEQAAVERRAAAPTEPIPLAEIALLSHTGYPQLLAETHHLNHPLVPAPVVEVVDPIEPSPAPRYAIDLGPLPVRPMPGWRGLARIRRKEATP